MTSIIELLQMEGIHSDAQFASWCMTRRLKGESRYQTLKRVFGEINANRIMRLVEVASWNIVDVLKGRKRAVRVAVLTTRPVRLPSQRHIAAIQRRKDLGYE